MPQVEKGSVSVSTPSTAVTFDRPMADANFSVVWVCRDPDDAELIIGCTVDPAEFTTTGFMVRPVDDGIFDYIAVNN